MESMKSKNVEFLLEEVELIYKPKFKISTRPVIKNSHDAYQLLRQTWDMGQIQLREQFKFLLFNRANRLLAVSELSTGGITGIVADIRLIFATALKANAVSLMMAHNHPSGSLKPSQTDIELTHQITKAGQFLEIAVLDHIIISSEGYLSMADEGLI